MKNVIVVAGLLSMALVRSASAAVGCTLANPAQDLQALFPKMTSYKEDAKGLAQMEDGEKLHQALKDRLGSDLDPLYEALDTPYTVYTVFQDKDVIGIVHGVNVPGKGGVIQVFLSVDPKSGLILRLFFQRLDSPAGKLLRKKEFLAQFSGMTLADFYKHDYYAAVEPGSEKDRVAAVQDPTTDEAGRADFQAALRGIRKNLILLDLLVFGRKDEAYYEKAREAIAESRRKAEAHPTAASDTKPKE